MKTIICSVLSIICIFAMNVVNADTDISVYFRVIDDKKKGLLNALSSGIENSQAECLPILQALGNTGNRKLVGRELPHCKTCAACASWGNKCLCLSLGYCNRRDMEEANELATEAQDQRQAESNLCTQALLDVEACINDSFPGLGLVDTLKTVGEFGCVEALV